MSGLFDRVQREPPTNIEAEQVLLATILRDNLSLEACADFLLPEHFADGAHQRIYAACLDMVERGGNACAHTLRAYFDHDDGLKAVGGSAYLAKLAAVGDSPGRAGEFAAVVHDLYLRRELMRVSQEASEDATQPHWQLPAADLIERTEAELFDLAERRADRRRPRSLGEELGGVMQHLKERIAAGGGLSGISTGLADIDEATCGLEPGQLVIIGAKQGMGKTALGLSMALKARLHGQMSRTLFFSLEMPAAQVGKRALTAMTGIPYNRINTGRISPEERAALAEAAEHLDNLPLTIDDESGHTPMSILTAARRHKRRFGLDLVMIDHLGFVGSGNDRHSPYEQASIACRGIKQAAKRLGVPIILLCQLSRTVDRREDKRPLMSDLRDSGNIEQDADIIGLLYREAYYLAREEPTEATEYQDWLDEMAKAKNKAEFIIAKQRNGAVGTKLLHYDDERMWFSNWSGR